MKARDVLMLFVLAGLWGASFLLVRVAVPVLGAFPLVFARVTLGGTAMLLYALSLRQPLLWHERWRQFLVMGLFNNAIPFTIFALAELHITGSFASIFNATTPLCTAVIAAIWLRDKLTTKKGLGLLLGLVGVGIVVGWQPTPLDTIGWLSVGACLLGALSYGIGIAMQPDQTLISVGLIGVLVWVATTIPAQIASKTDILEAMRYE